ncbi:MAG: peptide-methionine (S)-S-oxide reductase MsrA [Chloroflexi bacterium]|nr:peptide-methionine (S)-S-oxide reductase MsrA [Chloroflexota bacterium]
MQTETAVFGGGCFWCTEAAFQRLKGVTRVVPGYAGGEVADPSYEQVTTGRTGHAEVVQVEFDADVISYHDLLKVFFAVHDPTTPDRQGNDIGPQYRSIIFYANEGQKKEAIEFIGELNKEIGGGIVTEVKPLTEFYEAEEYHHNYFNRNPHAGYCQFIISPKMTKLHKEFKHLLQK